MAGEEGSRPKKEYPNLIPPKRGEVRNPHGHNGARWMRQVRKFFREKVNVAVGKEGQIEEMERFRLVLDAAYTSARRGNVSAQRFIIEQLAGRAKESVEVMSNGDQPSVVMIVPYNGRGPAPAIGDEPPDDEDEGGAGTISTEAGQLADQSRSEELPG
jgi:hypothetical protein